MKRVNTQRKQAGSGRSDRPLPEALDQLLSERGWTISELARRLGVSQPFLSRAVRGVDNKRASPDLIERIASELAVEPEHFVEFRRFRIANALADDPELTNTVYRLIERS